MVMGPPRQYGALMTVVRTSEVFTPAELPRTTSVDRTGLLTGITQLMGRKAYISLTGATKLGKTTFLRRYLRDLPEGSWSAYIPGQNLREGSSDLWVRLAQELGIPTSKETGLASNDKKTWGFIGRLALTLLPGSKATAGAQQGGESGVTESTVDKFTLNPEQAVAEALAIIRDDGRRVVIAIDDFHFVLDADKRQSIIIALRPLADLGVKIILSTILGGEIDPAFEGTNTGGRRKSLLVERWEIEDLEAIAIKGFEVLRLSANASLIRDLAEQSFGSPQIMQQLCLDLCELTNNIYERDTDADIFPLKEPTDRETFFRSLDDEEAIGWLKRLAAGPNPRKKRTRRVYPKTPPVHLDGYQLILQTLHELGSPSQVPLAELKQHVGSTLGLEPKELNKIALEQKARNLGEIAARDTSDAVLRSTVNETPASEEVSGAEDEDEAGEDDFAYAELIAKEAIPQPVFEVRGVDREATVSLLDPLFQYMIKWHADVIITAGRS